MGYDDAIACFKENLEEIGQPHPGADSEAAREWNLNSGLLHICQQLQGNFFSIASAIKTRLILRLDCRNSGATLWVGSAFLNATFDDKQNIANTAFISCFPGGTAPYTSVRIKEDRFGREIGSFTKEFGLEFR